MIKRFSANIIVLLQIFEGNSFFEIMIITGVNDPSKMKNPSVNISQNS